MNACLIFTPITHLCFTFVGLIKLKWYSYQNMIYFQRFSFYLIKLEYTMLWSDKKMQKMNNYLNEQLQGIYI